MPKQFFDVTLYISSAIGGSRDWRWRWPWCSSPPVKKTLTVLHSNSTHMWVLQYLTGISDTPTHNSYPQTPRRREESGRDQVKSRSGEVGFEVAHLHIIYIFSCPLLVRCFLYPFLGVQYLFTQTRLWRLGLLKSVSLGYLCDNPLPIHISRGPSLPCQPGLFGRQLASSVS